jgi:hypothetical protein
MAGTRTAPETTALDVSANQVTMHLVDISGDLKTENIKTPGGAILDNADIEAFAVAYQAASHASLWGVTQTIQWFGSINPSNAESGIRPMVEQGINIGFNDTDVFNSATTQRLLAPVAATMVGNTDTPVYPTVAPMTALLAAYIALLGAGYSVEFLQYTARRERSNNTRIRT